MAEAIQEELEEYRSSEEEVKKLKTSMGIDNESELAVALVTDNTAKITSAVQSLPQLLEKKRLIDMHTSIATGKLCFARLIWWMVCMIAFVRSNSERHQSEETGHVLRTGGEDNE